MAKSLRKISDTCYARKTAPRTGRFLLAFLVAGLFVPGPAGAQLVISEIMYDLKSGADGGREWVEIFNGGTTPMPLSTWKLFENGTSHKITVVAGGDVLAAGAYAVIADNAAKFKTDWPQFGGQLLDSAFSLSNEGEALVLRDASSTPIDSVSYVRSIGAAGDGNSLNRLPAQAGTGGTELVVRSPSPGAAMSTTALAPPPKAPVANAASKTKKIASAKPATATTIHDDLNVEKIGPESTITSAHASSGAAAAAASSNSFVWWLGAFCIAAFAAGSLFFARRHARKEWNIVEEREEGV